MATNLTSEATVTAMIKAITDPLEARIAALESTAATYAKAADVEASEGALQEVLEALSGIMASHLNDSEGHVSAQDRESWEGKANRTEVYPLEEIDAQFASKASASSVADLQTNKADKTDTYTKTQVDAKIAVLNGKTYNFSDWTNGALAAAIKEIYGALGGTVQEG